MLVNLLEFCSSVFFVTKKTALDPIFQVRLVVMSRRMYKLYCVEFSLTTLPTRFLAAAGPLLSISPLSPIMTEGLLHSMRCCCSRTVSFHSLESVEGLRAPSMSSDGAAPPFHDTGDHPVDLRGMMEAPQAASCDAWQRE